MKYFILLVLLTPLIVFGQGGHVISGQITDTLTRQHVANVSVKIKNTNDGTLTDQEGNFRITTTKAYPLMLEISSVGYGTSYILVKDSLKELSIALTSQIMMLDQIVISASRVKESLLRSPVSIEVLNNKAIQASSAPTFFDALENLKGVQMTTLSLGFKVPNTRGFAGTTNSRFLQMIDGVDNISPGLGAPIANAAGPTELDIESVELIPGAASAIYGLNAINGISNMKTKNAFDHPGLSVYQRTGINHVDGKDLAPSLYTETALRYSKVIGKRFAFKLNGSYSKGKDWVSNNQTDQYFTSGNKTNIGLNVNPGEDLINKYGDEYNSDLKTIKLAGKNYDVSRTGYYEKDLTNYDLRNAKFDAGVQYKVTKNIEAGYGYRIGSVSNYYQRGNRIRLDGSLIEQHTLNLKGSNFLLQAYYTKENTGGNRSFNLRPLAENIDLAFKKPTQWYSDFTKGFNNAYNAGNSIETSLISARQFADNGRYLPGTAAFDSVKNVIIHTNNWDTVGAELLLKSAFFHVEGQYNFNSLIPKTEIQTGFNYRNYIITPDGNEYINPLSFSDPKFAGKDFYYSSYGAFVQATKKLFDNRLKLSGSVRGDKSDYFNIKINPRVAAVYSPNNNNHFRVSFQNGYRFPTLFEGFAFVNNGGVKRLGGLVVTSSHLQVFENSYLNSSVTAFRNAVNSDINAGVDQKTAIQKEQGILVKSTYDYLKPEHLNSFETGYKGILLQNKLFIDVDYYLNLYTDFIGQLDVTQPYKGTIGLSGGDNDSTASYAFAGGAKVKKYKMWTNSKSKISNQGISVGVNYNVFKKYVLAANVSFAQLVQVSSADAFTPAFNTPKWISNVSIGNKSIFKNTGVNLTWHWQDEFYWNSPLANGNVGAYSTIDMQVSYRIPKAHSTLKIAGSNIFNHYYTQYIGGPSVGGFYYVTYIYSY